MPTPTDGYPGTPRWVKITGFVLLALVLLFLGARVFGVGGEHGPGRHAGESAADEPTGDAAGSSPDGGKEGADEAATGGFPAGRPGGTCAPPCAEPGRRESSVEGTQVVASSHG